MSARRYEQVLGEITTGIFACPDCGAVVWYSRREVHDGWHQQADNRREQVEALIDTTRTHDDLLDRDEQRLDMHADQIVALQGGSS
jgi:hypothetical protein